MYRIRRDNRVLLAVIFLLSTCAILAECYVDTVCPPQELILPCRCSQKGSEIQIWCSHSDLPRVLNGIKSTSKALNRPIDELILENNFLPSLPGRTFAQLQISRLMLRHNGLERLSGGWLNDVENSLVEIFIVERGLRSVPVDSLYGLRNLEAITIQSENLKRSPEFSGLLKLRYINIESESLIELSHLGFRDLLGLESVSIIGSKSLTRLDTGLFMDLPKLRVVNLQNNGIEWINVRTFSSSLISLQQLDLSRNRISNAGMVGRAIKDLRNLEVLNLNHNFIEVLSEASFVDLPSLKELRLNDNLIQELHHGAFHRVPSLKIVHLENNRLRHVHPESFLMSSGRGIEVIHLQNNDISRIAEVRSVLDALPTLRYLDLSNNKLTEIPFGALRGHGTLEQFQLENNYLKLIERDALMAMPSLRELRLKNNSLTDLLPMPFWNLPALKGLDISFNKFRRLEPVFFVGLPSLRRFDISENSLSHIDTNVFKSSPMLETVNISSNELATIDRSTFAPLTNLFEIDVSNNNLVEMISGLPRAIERVSVRNNKINNLATSPHTFDLPNLRMIDISNNELKHVHQVFTRSPQLRTIYLDKNKLTSIDETSFLGLNFLEVLNLQDNMIQSMHEMSTAGMGHLIELNLQGNRLETFIDKVLDNTPNIEKLDLSRNNIVEIMPNSFRNTRSLQTLDLSGNSLKGLPESLNSLKNLKEIDVSFNNIENLEPEVMKSWRNLEEFRASNNKLQELVQGTLKNLPVLQYVDLSSNDISSIHRGAVRNLPELQEIVLADNRLVELRERAFEDLQNLQAIHLQQNNLRMVSPDAFYNSPSILYLNLSTNQFRHLENLNIRNVRNLEVLDLSNNEIRRVASNPLRGLDWLVELKLNDNRICKIQGEPFSSMPRLRVLNLRNNRMGRLHEDNFRSLRSNIAVLDVEGNPIDCSCDTLWLRAWLQEAKSLSGPLCRDGTKLRDLDLNRQNCNTPDINQASLTNEHGDTFYRQNDFDDCGPVSQEGYEDFPPQNQQYYNNQRPSPIESDYFYDQYVDYPINETQGNTLNNSQLRLNQSSPYVDFNQNKFTLNQYPPRPPQPTSAFSFFGHPLPSFGNLWGNGRAANRATSGENNSRGKGRVQIFKAGDPELNVNFNRPTNEVDVSDGKNRDTAAASMKNPVVNKVEEKFYRPFFQTPFFNNSPPLSHPPPFPNMRPDFLQNQPPPQLSSEHIFSHPRPEKGFSPMIPGVSVGGFIPIQESPLNDTEAVNNNSWPKDYEDESDSLKKVPLVTRADTVTQKSVIKPIESYITAQIEKVHPISTSTSSTTTTQTKISHLQASISPILSTLYPKPELITEKSHFDNTAIETDSREKTALENEWRNSNKHDKVNFEDEIYRQNQESTSAHPQTSTSGRLMSIEEEGDENDESNIDQVDEFNETTNLDLSADHLIAPGSIVSQEVIHHKPPSSLPQAPLIKPGKITKVFTPAPPAANTNEISKLLSPFYQPSSEPSISNRDINYDNEYQPNQIFQQTFDGPKTSEDNTDQYQRDDMKWYFETYNNKNNHSNPILNYNSQPYDNQYGRYNSCFRTSSLSVSNLLVVVITISYLH